MVSRGKEDKFKMIDRNLPKKYILLLFNALDGKPIKDKITMMKMLFFISLNVPSLENELNFKADNYGPSSDAVLCDFESLNQEKFLKNDQNGYQLDSLGQEYLNSREFNDVDFDLIEDMKSLFDGLTVDEVCALTYFTYPETAAESIIKDRIYENRENLAISLYKKGKISLEKASEIAGVSITELNQMLSKQNIKVDLGF